MQSMHNPHVLRTCLLAATFGLVACGGDDGGGGGGLPRVGVVNAYPLLAPFAQPVGFTQAPGDAARAFVVTLGGTVHVLAHDAAAINRSPYLDIGALVTNAGGELGLLGFTFDPDFANNGFMYANYNPNFGGADGPRRTTIARYEVEANPNSVDPATETILLEFDQPFDNHNGGWLGFGPDDKLYIASGDGGSGNDPQNNAQNLNTLLGKFLRINADGSIPPDNPFIATGADEIWALGLRNPFRASFDRLTGELYAGDVGQGEREEIDVIVAGGNYGWRKYEGTRLNFPGDPEPSNAIAPLYEYGHDGGRCTIIGGYVYRGAALPAHVGAYFYADFCSGELFALDLGGARPRATHVGDIPGSPSSFGEDLDGELYVTSFDGHVYKIVPP